MVINNRARPPGKQYFGLLVHIALRFIKFELSVSHKIKIYITRGPAPIVGGLAAIRKALRYEGYLFAVGLKIV